MTWALRHRLVEDIVATVQVFAMLGFFVSVLGIGLRPDLRVTFELVLVGVALASTIVLLVHQKLDEAATAVWFAGVASIFAACDVGELVGRALGILFGLFCLWLMWYIQPTPNESG